MIIKDSSEVLFIGPFDSSKYTKLRGTAVPKRGQFIYMEDNNGNKEVYKARVNFEHAKYTLVEEKKQPKVLFYEGQLVHSNRFGQGKVIEILRDSSTSYPVRVRFNDRYSVERYTVAGKFYENDWQYNEGEHDKDITPVDVPVTFATGILGTIQGIQPKATLYANTYNSEFDARFSTTGREVETATPVSQVVARPTFAYQTLSW